MANELQGIIAITYEMEEKYNIFKERVAKGDITREEIRAFGEESQKSYYAIVDYVRSYWKSMGGDPAVIESIIKEKLGKFYKEKDF